MFAVETRGLTKRYGSVAAVDGLDLRVPRGAAYGFLGPNGAGKTTTIRLLLGLARPTSGAATLLGEKAGPGCRALERVGFLPDVPGFYGWMTAREYLAFSGRLFGLGGPELVRRSGELLELTGLAAVKTRVGGFSRGMRQRLGLAQALINRPELVILDEPTSALDPIGRHEVLETMRALTAAHATTVLFSTHILADVERVCDRVAIINRGRLVAEETLKELKARYSRPAFVVELGAGAGAGAAAGTVAGAGSGAERLEEALRGLGWVESVARPEGGSGGRAGSRPGGLVRVVARDAEVAKVELPRMIGQLGLPLLRFEMAEATLEDVFLRLVGQP